MLAWACALGILGLSGTTLCSQGFYYTKGPFRRANDCNMCFENECMSLDPARCDYYAEADSMLNKDDDDYEGVDNAVLRKEVDDMFFDLVDKVNLISHHVECIPYISRYTDCNKENVCLGCKICSCDAEGKWNCNAAQHCRTKDSPLNIDHRVLVLLMESLIDARKSRISKRSVTEQPEDDKVTASTLTLEQMSEWLYGVKPLNLHEYSPDNVPGTAVVSTDTDVVSTDTNVILTDATVIVPNKNTKVTEKSTTGAVTEALETGLTTTKVITETSTINTDTDYVAFDEVLRSIAVDTKSYTRRKLPLDNNLNNKTFDVDYMLMDEDNVTADNFKDDFAYMVNYMQPDGEVTESTVEGATKVVIDLLETATRDNDNLNITQDYDIYNKDADNINAFENTNDIIEYNAVNIMKRDVSAVATSNVVPTVTIIVNTTNTTNTTDQTTDIKQNILLPLNKILTEKKKEVEDLTKIKENLLKYVINGAEQAEDTGKENNVSNTYFSVYNLAMEFGLDPDHRRANPSLYDKYMFRLKTHIFEVIRDILAIQKHKGADIPEDLKILMHAMKRYVYKNRLIEERGKKVNSKRAKNFRRQMEKKYGRCDFISFKDCIVQIIEVIDKDMPKSNSLAPLSTGPRKIMKHLIKTLYVDELAVPGLRINDPNYNLTIDLQNVGSKWQQMTTNIISSTPHVTLYRMKLLHYVLTMDVSKMNDALALVDFAHSRRMLHTLDAVSDDILDQINAGLTAIHNKIQIIIRYYSQKPKPVTMKPNVNETTTEEHTKETIDSRKKKKRSFIKHIRSLLKTSKKDIAELLQRKVPKSEIVKQLARKKLDEISEKRYNEYEETMKRWQKNLDLMPRRKRSVLDTFKTRIKNIIPKYLRHKVNPRIKENKKNATANATRKADDRKKKRKAAKRGRKSRRTTTPKAKKVSEAVTPKVIRITTKKSTTVKMNQTNHQH